MKGFALVHLENGSQIYIYIYKYIRKSIIVKSIAIFLYSLCTKCIKPRKNLSSSPIMYNQVI